jgi:glutamine amidotransferase
VRIKLFDTGAGNLHSLVKALSVAAPESTVSVETDPDRALDTDLFVLPGVGAFGAAAARIRPARDSIRSALLEGLPALGICLGMQLLMSESEEGEGQGLDIIPGRVTRLHTPRTPHMGWTPVEGQLDWVSEALPSALYFAHTFACRPVDRAHVIAECEVPGDRFAAVIARGRTIGCQFHPEKSSRGGLGFLARVIQAVTS